ncbi:MAG TPA: proline--tRNA ligase [Candidatus Peribacterales bacterium]|nr:proline--tRNA ligase [Candidatus Peribacterales bacterium]
MSKLASQKDDFPQWYLDVVEQADLAEYAPVKGCIIFKPYGYAIWEMMQQELNARIKDLGVQNAYFPLLIPESVMAKEANHVAGFAPECAVVTHGGGKELAEKLYIRPTSETIIYQTFAKWVGSYRDLPIKINQWANVVRWEMRTRPFLRTLEFLWQEGHTVHATKEDADEMAEAALQMYTDFDRDVLALPVIHGRKPEHDKFAGALYTLTTEALARDGKAIQAGTSHNLGQGFSESYSVSYLDENQKEQRPWMTSWGVSTRLIGTIIVVHGDEKGLRLPPAVAPIQVVIVPIYQSDAERDIVLAASADLAAAWGGQGIRVHIDSRDGKRPGFKFAEWEVKGVPLRVEIGPKDIEKKQVTIVRRDTGEKEHMLIDAARDALAITNLLDLVQENLYDQALQFMEDQTSSVETYDEFKKTLEEKPGFIWAPWDGTVETAEAVQKETKATIRVLLPERPSAEGMVDMYSGKPAKEMVLWAKAY